MEYKVLNNGLRMPMVGLGVYNISERETQRVVEDAKVMPVVNQYETHVLIYQGENAICIKTPMLNYGYVITDQKTTNSVKYHHYAIVQLQKKVYLCRPNSTK